MGWLIAILLKPLVPFAYAGLLATLLWLARKLPAGRLRTIATYRFALTPITGWLVLVLAAGIIVIPLAVAAWLGLY